MGKTFLLLAGIVALGFILRFTFLGSIPVSVHRDEAFLGYNAYSILLTGKDISGHSLPLHLESFFYSPSGYSYFSIPFIAIFGLSEFSIRSASALSGTLTIPLVYFLSLHLFKDRKNRNQIGLLSAFILAILPWHVNLSRVAVESAIVVFFIALGVLFYLKFIEKKNFIFVIASYFCFLATIFTYQAPRAFLPIFIPLLGFYLFGLKGLIKAKLQIALFLLLIAIPAMLILISPNLSWRIQSLSIFNHPETQAVINEELINDGISGVPSTISRLFHNKVSNYSLLFFDNFFSHLSFDFLFSDGGLPERFKIPRIGLLYLFQLPLLLIAFVSIWNKNRRLFYFIFGWIGLSFLGSSLTYDDVPNLQRTLIAVPPIVILSGYGLAELYLYLKTKKYNLISAYAISFIIISSVGYFLMQYFVQGRLYRTWVRQDGYKELVKVTNDLLPNYQKAVITNRESAPTIFYLFYSRYDPSKFQSETKKIDMKKSDHVNFSKYEFSEEECPLRIDNKTQKLTGERNILYVNSSLCKEELPDVVRLYDIKRAGGLSSAFFVLEVK